MIQDPIFWLCAIIAVIITGISKGGFGGLALFAVPLMALTVSPIQAAGIMLPILIVMDWVSLWAYRKSWSKKLLWLMLPGAVLGIAVGGLLAGYVDENATRIVVGLIAIAFPVHAVGGAILGRNANHKPRGTFLWNKPLGAAAGFVAGFTSFIAHAGGPPFQAYAIPHKLDKRVYAGTAVVFFTVVNAVKVIPYAVLGQFDATNLTTSALLIPLAPIGVFIGVWLLKRINQDVFYRIMYTLIFITGCKLLCDGLV